MGDGQMKASARRTACFLVVSASVIVLALAAFSFGTGVGDLEMAPSAGAGGLGTGTIATADAPGRDLDATFVVVRESCRGTLGAAERCFCDDER